FVAGRRADPEPAAQLPNIGPFLRSQHHKLQSRVHPRHLVKRHPTASLIRCRKCPRCLRTPVHFVPGLNKKAGRGRNSSRRGTGCTRPKIDSRLTNLFHPVKIIAARGAGKGTWTTSSSWAGALAA